MLGATGRFFWVFACVGLIASARCQWTFAEDAIVIADFEGSDYGTWTTTGDAFGKGPAKGTLANQMQVEGYLGERLVNSFQGGDGATGTLTSPPFRIERKYITFLIGGGGWAEETCMNLIVDGQVVRTASGPNTISGGSERLSPLAWDVHELIGKSARIAIVDNHRGGWGHINVDHIQQVQDKGSAPLAPVPQVMLRNATRQIKIQNKFLLLPVKNDGKKRVVEILVDGKGWQKFDIELADDQADWWAQLDVESLNGKAIDVVVDRLPADSKALDQVHNSEQDASSNNLYAEALRSQFHFSPKRGWTNDPNGLVYFNGEYHLFFQHNPYGWNWGNMHWGHAVSRDLVHWNEIGEALYPDETGPMFSGSAVVDWNNTSGFGAEGKPPLVLIYTAAGNPTTQCIAYSLDGRHFTKYANNPVIQQITAGNRDPKVFWHAPSRQWVMVLYVELDGKHTIQFMTSPNLKQWSKSSIVPGGSGGDKYLFECPDLFELPIDGLSSKSMWVLNAADSRYALGSFDGRLFQVQQERIDDVRGRGFYAAQTFSDTPGRRIQIGWLQAASPGMAFNQLQSLPMELSLKSTPAGPRLVRKPVTELQTLRTGGNQADSLAEFRSELIELIASWDANEEIEMQVRDASLRYEAQQGKLTINDVEVALPKTVALQSLHIFVDRTVVEVLAADGQVYVTLPLISRSEHQSVQIAKGTDAFKRVELYRLDSIWRKLKQP